jgi:hypothetical protein
MIAYVDTSACCASSYVSREHSTSCVPTTPLFRVNSLRFESARIINRLRLHGSLTADEAAARLRIVSDWLEAIDLVLLRPSVLSRASEPMPMAIGTLDAVHLATALIWRDRMGPLQGHEHANRLGPHGAGVLGGSIRKGGSAIRVSAQLVDTQTGAQLWAETYNRDLRTSSMFLVQDDVAARIVATVTDSYGVLVHSMRSATGRKADADLAPVEWQFE